MGVGGGQRKERVIYTFWNQPGAAFGRNDEPSIAFCFHYFFLIQKLKFLSLIAIL